MSGLAGLQKFGLIGRNMEKNQNGMYKEWKKVGRILIHAFFILYMLVLLRITVFRSTLSFDYLFLKGNVNLTFFESYIALLQEH